MEMEALTHWHWWGLAVFLVVLEIFAPGVMFLWLAIAASLVGVLLLVAPGMGWEYQVLVFSVVSVASIFAWRRYQNAHPTETDQPTLNRRGQQYVSRRFTLEHPIVNGLGKIRVDDSTWKIEGEDCEAGTHVEVIGVKGTILEVKIIN